MKYSLTCNVSGKVMIGKELKAIKGTKEYILIPDKKGFLVSIKIITKVENVDKYVSKIEPGKGEIKSIITIGGDRDEYLNLVKEFQELESILSFSTNGALKTISWDAPKREFISENLDEAKQVSVRSIEWTKEYMNLPSVIDEKIFASMIQDKENYTTLVVPKSFFR